MVIKTHPAPSGRRSTSRFPDLPLSALADPELGYAAVRIIATSASLSGQVVDDPAQCRHSVRVPKISRVLVGLGLTSFPHAAQLVDHLLKSLLFGHAVHLGWARPVGDGIVRLATNAVDKLSVAIHYYEAAA
jgi:hypothetical protein